VFLLLGLLPFIDFCFDIEFSISAAIWQACVMRFPRVNL